jgi:hypothetical protein
MGSDEEKIRSPVGSIAGIRNCWHPLTNNAPATSHHGTIHALRVNSFMTDRPFSVVRYSPPKT